MKSLFNRLPFRLHMKIPRFRLPLKKRDNPSARKKDRTGDHAVVRRKRGLHAFWHLIRSFLRKMSKDRIDVYSAQAAFYLVMALIPMLMMVLMFLKFTPFSEEMILSFMKELLNQEIMNSVTTIIGNVYHGSVTVLSITTLTMLWVSGRAMAGLTNGLNSIYGIRENRNFFKLRLRSCLYTLMLIAAFIVSLAILAFGMQVRDYLGTVMPLFRITNRIMRYILAVIALLLLTGIFNLLYVVLPNQAMSFRSQVYGSVFTTVSWVIFTRFFLIYLSLAKNLSVIYGGLLTIAVIMLWLYFCLYLFFFGAEINAWKENPDSFPF